MPTPQSNSLTLVATLTVRKERVADFQKFEKSAAPILVRHGGRIERTVAIPAGPGGEFYKEVHIVSFPDAAAFQAYRDDEETRALNPLRESCIFKTEIWQGTRGPNYHA